jgi:hypothetical protein
MLLLLSEAKSAISEKGVVQIIPAQFFLEFRQAGMQILE